MEGLSDEDLAARAVAGDRSALEALLERSAPWIHNVALRMVWDPEDARDVTQEVLLKVLTRLSSFEGRSRFRTWLYRVVANHVLNMKARAAETSTVSFTQFRADLQQMEDADFPDTRSLPADAQIVLDEVRIGCTHGMLLCLDREQRLVYVLGEILGVQSGVGGDVLGISPDSFRQKLSRARRDLYAFMNQQCGLVRRENPCRCARKTAAFIGAGVVDPDRLRFAAPHVRRVHEVTPAAADALDELEVEYAGIFRSEPFHDAGDAVRELLARPDVRELLSGSDGG